MKFLQLLIQNIKRMVKQHPLMLLILMLGITVSSTALCVYYGQSAAIAEVINNYRGIDRVVDFEMKDITNPQTYAAIEQFLSGGEDSLDYYCVMSVEKDAYDIIGIHASAPQISVTEGEWLSGSGIVCPYMGDLKTGDTFSIDQNTYTVCGLYPADYYSADQFSSRRIAMSDYAAAGVVKDSSLEYEKDDPYDMSDRTCPAVFMDFSQFAAGGYRGDILRVRFIHGMSEQELEEFSQSLVNHCAQQTGETLNIAQTGLSSAKAVYGVQFLNKFMLYIMVVLLSLINILALFVFILKKNAKQFILFKMSGATNGLIKAVTAVELLIYTIISFTVGFFIAKVIISVTYLKDNGVNIGPGVYFMLLAAVVFVILTSVLLQLNRQLKDMEHKAEQPEPLFPLHKIALKARLKNAYLVLKGYSGNILSEFIILLQVMFVAFSFTYAISYTYERGALTRYTNKVFGDNIPMLFTLNERLDEVLHALPREEEAGQGYVKDAQIDAAYEAIGKLDGLEGYGSKAFEWIWYPLENPTEEKKGDQLNPDILSPEILNRMDIPVEKGVWLTQWADGVDILETGYIPVVLSKSCADMRGLAVGDVIENAAIMREAKFDIDEHEDGTFDYTVEAPHFFSIKIVGILADGARAPMLGSKPVTLDSILYPMNETELYCYAPQLSFGDALVREEGLYFGHALLFADSESRLSEYRTALADYGYVYSIEDLAKASDEFFEDGSSEYMVHLYITLCLLFVGVAGYNLLSLERQKRQLGIYFACGMPWKKAIAISMTANGLIFLLGGIAGSVWGLVSASSTRTMMADTKLYSILTAVGFIMLLFLISSVSMLVRMLKTSPVSLIKKGD